MRHSREFVNIIVKELLARKDAFGSHELAQALGVSRQAVHHHLSALVASGALAASGRGRATTYHSGAHRPVDGAASPPPSARPSARVYQRTFPLRDLGEDAVWSEARQTLLPMLAGSDAKNAAAILAYAFTEMLNNAIDHSDAREVDVEVDLVGGQDVVTFQIADAGIGVYENVRSKLGLPDHLAALQEISKGKISTMPERHSGEGIFFTSKMADRFELSANDLTWMVDNARGDQAIAASPTPPGTRVRFELSLATSTTPEEIFARYTHDFTFDTTRAVVRLFEHGVRFVSRSEAKRLLSGLDRFAEVILDFHGVEGVGQGFVDEVFRVWARAHPQVRLHPEAMNPAVRFMVERGLPRPA